MNTKTTTPRRSSFTLLEGLVLLLVFAGLVWLIAWGVERTKRQAERSHAKKVLRDKGFVLVLDQKDHVARSDDLAGAVFTRPSLQSRNVPFDRELLSQIALLDELQDLRLRNSFLNDGELGQLASLKQLRVLDLSGTLITDDGLEILSGFSELEELDISLTKARGPGLRHLKPLKNLRTLRVTNNEIPDAALPHLAALTQLTSLDVRQTWLSDASLKKLEPVLVNTSSRFRDRFQEMQEVAGAFDELETSVGVSRAVNLLDSSWPGKLKAIIPPDGRITRLSLQNADLRLPRFESVRGEQFRLRFPHLQYLNLSHTRFTAPRSPAFVVMGDLRELNIVASDCGDLAFGRLRSCSRLRTLDARLCDLSNDSVHVIGSLKNLQTLRLGQNYITDKWLKELLNLKKLKRLELDSCEITDEGLEVLATLPGLRHLSLSRTYVTRDGVTKLARARPEIEVRLIGVNAVAATDELVGKFNRTREAQILGWLEEESFKFQIEGSYGRVIAVRFPKDYLATDEDMKWLGRFTGMRDFHGEELSQVTAKGVRELAELTELKYLYLKSPRLDRSTLDELLRFRDLERAYLYGTSITEKDVEAFRRKYPQHDVAWNSSYIRMYLNYHADKQGI